MPKPLVFEFIAQHAFKPAERGFLMPGGVVHADTFVSDQRGRLMAVRALEHIDAGRRGRFVEDGRDPRDPEVR